MFGLTGLAARIVSALLVGIVTFIIILIVAYVLGLIPMLAGVGAILSRFGVILAVLAGLAAFFSGWTPTHRTPA